MPATKGYEVVKRTEVRFPPETYKALAARARYNKRSLNNEMMCIVEDALRHDRETVGTAQGPWQPTLERK